MKTIDEILENVGVVTSTVSGLQTYTKENVKLAMKKYATEVLLEFTKDKQKVNIEGDWLVPNTSIFKFIQELNKL